MAAKKILFCGGGTLGPVTPLLAVLRRMRELQPGIEFAWIGTPQGPEAPLIQAEGVPFHALSVAKVTRRPGLNWLTFPFDYLKAAHEAEKILAQEKPDLVVSAGGYTQVPVFRAAFKLRIPCATHQLDYTPLLSNTAVAKMCKLVTTSFDYPKPVFGQKVKSLHVATPCRFAGVPVPERAQAAQTLGYNPDKPLVLVVGGGTGALALNQALLENLDELLGRTQILHLTGKGKMSETLARDNYRAFEFFDETKMLNAYQAATFVVSRGGFGALSELSALSKAAIIIPILDSPQEQNAKALEQGIVEVSQSGHFATKLKTEILSLLDDASRRQNLGKSLHELLNTDDGTELAQAWLNLLV